MANSKDGAKGKPTASNAEAILRHREKIAELQRSVDALKEKEGRRLLRLAERAGWFDALIPDEAFSQAIGALVERHRGASGAARSASPGPNGANASPAPA